MSLPKKLLTTILIFTLSLTFISPAYIYAQDDNNPPAQGDPTIDPNLPSPEDIAAGAAGALGNIYAGSQYAYKQLTEFTVAIGGCVIGTEYSLPCLIYNSLLNIIISITNMLMDVIPTTHVNPSPKHSVPYNPQLKPEALFGPSLASTMTNTMSALYQYPPAQTSVYIADLKQNFMGETAYAQGYGYKALNPVLEVWKAFRNISLFFFVILFMALGFMIMFRTKVNPQTTISIQNSLPRIIVTLILIVFSYPLVGFMIDLMYLLTALIVKVFVLNGLIVQESVATKVIFQQNLFITFFKDIFAFKVTTVNIQGFEVPGVDPATFVATIPVAIAGIVHGIFGDFTSGIGKIAESGTIIAASLVGIIIVVVALIFTMLRLFMSLLSSFVNIILSVILAPLLLSFNALPGSNAFMNWFKNLLANILVFPGVALFLLLSGILVNSENFGAPPNSPVGYNYERPNQTPFAPPMLVTFNGNANFAAEVQFLLAFGLILLSPTVAQMIKDSMKVEPFKYSKDIGAAVSAGTWPIRFLMEQQQERKAMLKQEQMLRAALSSKQA